MASALKNPRTNRRASSEKAALSGGTAGGTVFAGLVLLIPGDSVWKKILLVLAPTITLIISSFWDLIIREIDILVVDWRIRAERKRLENRLTSLGPTANQQVRERAQKDLDALTMIESEIIKERVETILSP